MSPLIYFNKAAGFSGFYCPWGHLLVPRGQMERWPRAEWPPCRVSSGLAPLAVATGWKEPAGGPLSREALAASSRRNRRLGAEIAHLECERCSMPSIWLRVQKARAGRPKGNDGRRDWQPALSLNPWLASGCRKEH